MYRFPMEVSNNYFHPGFFSEGNLQLQENSSKAAGDHFIVEDLFDFSDDAELAEGGGEEVCDAVTKNLTDSSAGDESFESSLSGGGPHFYGELCEPDPEVAELEWLSNFIEDCFSNQNPHQISTKTNQFPPEAPVPAKARSKRSRAAPASWSSRLPLFPDPNSNSSLKNSGDPAAADWSGRKCSHCASEKTPQWRAGPMGPKTLCNACGVRHKSGRLVPEYRPAASPTFVESKHSNSHRKVVELRRLKESQQQQKHQFFY